MMFTIEELYCLHAMNKKTGPIPGVYDLYKDKSRSEIRALFKRGQDLLIKRGLGTEKGEAQQIISYGALLEVYVEQTDFIRVDNITFETSNNQILSLVMIEKDGMYDFVIQYKGFLFVDLLEMRKMLLRPSTEGAKDVTYSESIVRPLSYQDFIQQYGEAKDSTFIQRIENNVIVFSRIVFNAGFTRYQYDFLSSELKTVPEKAMANQLYKWFDIVELEYSREEIQELAKKFEKGEAV